MIFTFGVGQTHPVTGENLEGHYVEIDDPDFATSRTTMVRYFGDRWAYQYDTADLAGVDEYGLTPIELPDVELFDDQGNRRPPLSEETSRRILREVADRLAARITEASGSPIFDRLPAEGFPVPPITPPRADAHPVLPMFDPVVVNAGRRLPAPDPAWHATNEGDGRGPEGIDPPEPEPRSDVFMVPPGRLAELRRRLFANRASTTPRPDPMTNLVGVPTPPAMVNDHLGQGGSVFELIEDEDGAPIPESLQWQSPIAAALLATNVDAVLVRRVLVALAPFHRDPDGG